MLALRTVLSSFGKRPPWKDAGGQKCFLVCLLFLLLRTEHVVKLIGMVTKSQPVLVLMEFMENGDLENFLRNCRQGIKIPVVRSLKYNFPSSRPGNESNLEAPSDSEILQMASEIADGMAYLESRKIIHR